MYGCAGVREIGWLLSHAVPDLFVCVCVCEREREREWVTEREREKERESLRVCGTEKGGAICCRSWQCVVSCFAHNSPVHETRVHIHV